MSNSLEFLDEIEEKLYTETWGSEPPEVEFYKKGKLAALHAIWRYIEDGGGGARTISYDYLNIAHCDCLEYGSQELANWVYRKVKDDTRLIEEALEDSNIQETYSSDASVQE